jgi:hypothetical protein
MVVSAAAGRAKPAASRVVERAVAMVFFMVIPVDLLGGCRRFVAPVACLAPRIARLMT